MVKNYLRIYILIAILVVTIIILWVFLPKEFINLNTMQSLGYQLPILGLFALALIPVVLTGGIDLSIIAIANITGLVAGFILKTLNRPNMSITNQILVIALAIVAAFVVSLICGLLNGLIIAKLGVNPVLATIGTSTVFNGLVAKITEGYGIAGFVDKFSYIGNGDIFNVPVSIIICVICYVIMGVILNRTKFGFSLYMVGSNQNASEFSGINVKATLIKVYLNSSIMAMITGIIMISQFNSVKGGYGASYLLIAILIVVFGGVSILGGSGGVIGVFIAACILQIVWSGFNILQLSPFLTQAIWGIILILVLIATYYINTYSRKMLIKKVFESKVKS